MKRKILLLINAILFLVMLSCAWYFRTNYRLLMQPLYNVLYTFFVRTLLCFLGGSLIGYFVVCHDCFRQKARGRKVFYWSSVVIGLMGLIVALVSPIIVWKTESSFVVPLAKTPIVYALFGFLMMIGGNGLIRMHERRRQ